MDNAAVNQELPIALHEVGGGETFPWVLHLRIAEGEPYLLHFVLGEETLDDLDVRAQEGDILQSFVERLSGTCPHTSPFDIDAYEIHLRV